MSRGKPPTNLDLHQNTADPHGASAPTLPADAPKSREVAGQPLVIRAAMMRTFQKHGITLVTWAEEVLSVCRAAAADGEYAAALKGYESIGKYLGAIGTDTHQHLHLHGAPMTQDKMKTMSDDQLRAYLAQQEADARAKVEHLPPIQSAPPEGAPQIIPVEAIVVKEAVPA